MTQDSKVVVMVTSQLLPEFASQIAAVDPERVELIFRPDLYPPLRYVADHTGPADWRRTQEQTAEWKSLLARAEVLWDFVPAYDGGPFELSPNLKWVQTSSAGVGQAVHRLGVAESDLIVTTSSGIHAGPLTEFVIGAILFHVKKFRMLMDQQAAHHWERYCADEVAGKTIAILGPGRIGRQIAVVAKSLGMQVHVMPRTADPARRADLSADRVFGRDQLHEMLSGADFVVLSTPHTPETQDLIGPSEISAMKPGVVLVNIARGAVIDEPAMIEALQSGHIAFAALDVFRTEPLPNDSPLWDMPNVLVNPHSASTAYTENERIIEIFCRNLRCYLDGRIDEMSPVLDKARMY